MPYAPVHQFGTRHIPQRRFLPFTSDGSDFESGGLAGAELRAIENAITLYILEGRIE